MLVLASKSDPVPTPATVSTGTKVKVAPSAEISVTLLKIGSTPGNAAPSALVYEIIASVFIPTTPANLLPGAEALVAVTFNWSVIEKLGKIRS